MEEMQVFQHRLKSFGNRGCNWPHKHFKATGLRLAQVGFYYDSKDIYNDKVTCYLCNCSYYGWKKDDVPMEIHKKISPNCPLIIILDYSKNWIKNPIEDSNYEPESSTLLKARLATFKNWWPHKYPNITAERIAEAGLYYAPDIDSDDRVECAYCKAKFDYWTSNDNPRSKHFRFKEKCPFFCSTQLKRRKLKRLQNKEKANAINQSNEIESDFTDNSFNKRNNRRRKYKNKKEDDDMDTDSIEDEKNNDNEEEEEVKKTYNTRYSTREIKKVNYVEEDTDDELFLSEENNSEEGEEGEEGEENNEIEDDEDYSEIQDDSILVDESANKQSSSEESDEEVLSKKKERNIKNKEKNIIGNNNSNNNNNNILEDELNNNITGNTNEGVTEDVIENVTEDAIENAIEKTTEDATEDIEEPHISIKKTDVKKSEKEKEAEVKKEKSGKSTSDDEYVKSSNSDYSYASSSYEELLKKRSSAKKKRPKKTYRKRKKKSLDDSLLFDDDELDSEEEELRTKEFQKLLSTENGYLGPLPKIKSKVVIEEEKKLYEEMKRRAEENESSDFDIENTNPEFVSVTSILRKRKKELSNNSYEFGFSPKRISLSSSREPEIVIDHNQSNNSNKKDITEKSILNNDNNEDNIENNIENNIEDKMEMSIDNDIQINTKENNENADSKEEEVEINDIKTKTPITIQKIKKEKDFTIVKILNTINQTVKEPRNLLETISKQRIEDVFKNTPIKLINNKNQMNLSNTQINISAEDFDANNIFMFDDKEANLDLLKEKIIEILMENSKKEKDNAIENKISEVIDKQINNNENNEMKTNEDKDKMKKDIDNKIDNHQEKEQSKENELNSMDVDENPVNTNKEIELIEILDDSTEVVHNGDNSVKKNDINEMKETQDVIENMDMDLVNENNELDNNQEDEFKNKNNGIEEKTNVKKKEFYEIKSSDKKILKELSFSITTPEPNSPKINPISEKSGDKTFKTPLSSQVKNFHLSSDISLEETVEALLSTPTPLPLGLNTKSNIKNDKELIMKTILEENKKSLKKLNNPSKLLQKQNIRDDNVGNGTKRITDSVKSNKSVQEYDENNVSFMSYDDNSLMFKNDDSVIIRLNQKSDDNIEKIVNTINKLKATIDTVSDVSTHILDDKQKKKQNSTDNNVSSSNQEKYINEREKSIDSISSKSSVNEEEILDNYFNNLISTPNTNSSEKAQSMKKVIEVEDNVLSMTVGQYLEKVNKDIAEKLRLEGEEKIREYYKQLFNIEDLYIQYLDKMVSQLQEYPKDKKILESQTKLMKTTLNNDRKNVKMEIKTSSNNNTIENNNSLI